MVASLVPFRTHAPPIFNNIWQHQCPNGSLVLIRQILSFAKSSRFGFAEKLHELEREPFLGIVGHIFTCRHHDHRSTDRIVNEGAIGAELKRQIERRRHDFTDCQMQLLNFFDELNYRRMIRGALAEFSVHFHISVFFPFFPFGQLTT